MGKPITHATTKQGKNPPNYYPWEENLLLCEAGKLPTLTYTSGENLLDEAGKLHSVEILYTQLT